MKKTLNVLSVSALALIMLASCGGNEESKDSEQSSSFDATTLINSFDKELSTTIKLTYNANYDMDVNSNGGTANMDSFKHKIRATTEVSIDLGSDLYIKTKKTKKDELHDSASTVTEEILYKKDGKYYYETSSTNALEVESSAARNKVNEILKSVTTEQAGSIDLSTLLYNSTDRTYFENQLFCSDAILGADKDDYLEAMPEYQKEGEGLKATYKPEYVGYTTDGGQSDLKNSTDGYAASYDVVTNKNGQVTSFKETYNSASLDMHIMTIPPTIILTGYRSFSAEYGASITKESSVAKLASTVSFADSTGGTYTVATCAMGDFTNMTVLSNGESLEVGKLVCVKPAPANGKEVKSVTLNGSSETLIDPTNAGGWYCFNVAIGANEVVVEFKDSSTSGSDTTSPTLKYQYSGTVNNIAINLNLYDDNTFTVTCPSYNGAKAVSGTYTMSNGTLTLNASSIQYFTYTTQTSTLTVSSDFKSLTGNFFNESYPVTLSYVAQSK